MQRSIHLISEVQVSGDLSQKQTYGQHNFAASHAVIYGLECVEGARATNTTVQYLCIKKEQTLLQVHVKVSILFPFAGTVLPRWHRCWLTWRRWKRGDSSPSAPHLIRWSCPLSAWQCVWSPSGQCSSMLSQQPPPIACRAIHQSLLLPRQNR